MERKKRVNIDKNVEVLIVNNSNKRIIYNNARMQTPIDLDGRESEEYITVGDLRTVINTDRKIFENFSLIVADILSDEYTLEDLFKFIGLEKAYDEYYSLRPNSKDKDISVNDIENFILKSNAERFGEILKNSSIGLRAKIIEESVLLFKGGKFVDYNKMNVIRAETKNEDLFLDAEETQYN